MWSVSMTNTVTLVQEASLAEAPSQVHVWWHNWICCCISVCCLDGRIVMGCGPDLKTAMQGLQPHAFERIGQGLDTICHQKSTQGIHISFDFFH